MLTCKKTPSRWAITLLATAGLVLAAPGASAEAIDEGGGADHLAQLPVAIANPDVPLDVIASLPEVVQLSDVMIDETFEVGMPIVHPDGSPVEGRGYTSQKVVTWYSVGCGTSTGGSVHWGNVLGNPAFRAQSLSVPLSISVRWSS